MKKHLIEFYLEWMNDWLTVQVMAEWHGLSYEQTNELINLGRSLHEEFVKLKEKRN